MSQAGSVGWLFCRDCSVDVVAAEEYCYMVSDDVWKASGLGGNDGKLCVGCLEQRIGRRLAAADFPTDIPLNCFVDSQSPRLRERFAA